MDEVLEVAHGSVAWVYPAVLHHHARELDASATLLQHNLPWMQGDSKSPEVGSYLGDGIEQHLLVTVDEIEVVHIPSVVADMEFRLQPPVKEVQPEVGVVLARQVAYRQSAPFLARPQSLAERNLRHLLPCGAVDAMMGRVVHDGDSRQVAQVLDVLALVVLYDEGIHHVGEPLSRYAHEKSLHVAFQIPAGLRVVLRALPDVLPQHSHAIELPLALAAIEGTVAEHLLEEGFEPHGDVMVDDTVSVVGGEDLTIDRSGNDEGDGWHGLVGSVVHLLRKTGDVLEQVYLEQDCVGRRCLASVAVYVRLQYALCLYHRFLFPLFSHLVL